MNIYKIIRKIKLPKELLNIIISYYGNSIFEQELYDYYEKHKINCPRGIYYLLEKINYNIMYDIISYDNFNSSICHLCGNYLRIKYIKNMCAQYCIKTYQFYNKFCLNIIVN